MNYLGAKKVIFDSFYDLLQVRVGRVEVRGVQWAVLPILARGLAHYNVVSCRAVPCWPGYCNGPGWQGTDERVVPCLRKWPIVPPCRPIMQARQPIVPAHRVSPSC